MIIRAVAWDIDGTLVDSEPLHHRALLAASLLWDCDLSDLPDQAFRGVHMHDVWEILRSRLPEELEKDIWLEAIDLHYANNTEYLLPIAGAVQAVRALAQNGTRQICVSNSSRSVVDANLKALGINPYLEFSVSLDDVRTGKPDPEPYLQACARLGLDPGAVAAIEDSRSGALAARRAGMVVIGFSATGGGFEDVDVDHTIADFMTLPNLISVGLASPG